MRVLLLLRGSAGVVSQHGLSKMDLNPIHYPPTR